LPFPSLTWGANQWSNNRTDRWDISDDLSLNLGSHGWKFGGSFLNFDSAEEQANNIGSWTFRSDQYFNPDDPASLAGLTGATQYTASFPPLPRHLEGHWIQWYVQDDWRAVEPDGEPGGCVTTISKSYNNQLDLTGTGSAELIDRSPATTTTASGPAGSRGTCGAMDVRWSGAHAASRTNTSWRRMRPEVAPADQHRHQQSSYRIRTAGVLSRSLTAPPNVSVLDDDIKNASQVVHLGIFPGVEGQSGAPCRWDLSNVDGVALTGNINTPIPSRVTGHSSPGAHRPVEATGAQYRALYVRLGDNDRHQYLFFITCRGNGFGMGTQPQFTIFITRGLDWGPGSDRRKAFVAKRVDAAQSDIILGAVWTRSTMPFSARAGLDLNRDSLSTTSKRLRPGHEGRVQSGNNTALLGVVNLARPEWKGADSGESTRHERLQSARCARQQSISHRRGSKIELIAGVQSARQGLIWGHPDNLDGKRTVGLFGRILSVLPRQRANWR
jgi:hypothetical protein